MNNDYTTFLSFSFYNLFTSPYWQALSKYSLNFQAYQTRLSTIFDISLFSLKVQLNIFLCFHFKEGILMNNQNDLYAQLYYFRGKLCNVKSVIILPISKFTLGSVQIADFRVLVYKLNFWYNSMAYFISFAFQQCERDIISS